MSEDQDVDRFMDAIASLDPTPPPTDDRGQRALAERLLHREDAEWMAEQGLTEDEYRATFVERHVDDLYDNGRTFVQEAASILGEHGVYLPDGMPTDGSVCACLDETGERKVRVYDRCERCGAFMESAYPAELERLQRIEAAAWDIVDQTFYTMDGEVLLNVDLDGIAQIKEPFFALRAALATDGAET